MLDGPDVVHMWILGDTFQNITRPSLYSVVIEGVHVLFQIC